MGKRREYAVADCETDPFVTGRTPMPFLWGFYDGATYEQFRTTEQFTRRIKQYPGRIYAHNGGRFDWHYLLDDIDPGRLMVINGRIAKARLGTSELRDSFNLLPTALAAYQKTEIDYGIFEAGIRDEPENRKRIESYLWDDCRFLYEYLGRYREEYPDALTQAGAAMQIWHQLGGEVPKSTPAFYEKISRYYFGGRVEAFQKGVIPGDVTIADIKSAYPFAMLHPHPIGTKYRVTRNPRDSDLSKCFFVIDGVSEGALPIRRKGGGIDFPHGRGRFRVPGWEVIAGLETGTLKVEKIRSVIMFDTYTTFGEYVHYFYDKKLACEQSGDATGRLLAKLFLNSLYGKFGANPARYKEHGIFDYADRDARAQGWRGGDLIGSRQLYTRPIPEWQARYYNVATAASITSFVRAYLWRTICETENAIYCDTDSVIAPTVGGITVGDNLGDWELEARGDRAAIAGKKLYAVWDGKQCVKSASKGVKLTPSEILRVANGEEITYHSSAPSFSVLGNRNINADPEKLFLTRKVSMT